jgi:Icc-related predicted phosphoesterase
MKFKITFISDTHGKHNQITKDLPGGDILIHAGDFMNSGYSKYEALDFFIWFDSIKNYDNKIFIAGNHDRLMEFDTQTMLGELTGFKTIDYLQDEELGIYHDDLNGDHSEDNIHIYGSPWQPEFYNWAFNLPRNGSELKERWGQIPNNTDILITHGPPFGFLDIPGHGTPMNIGCEMLRYRIDELRPKIHVFGHIHGSAGYYFNGHTHFINASVLNERYMYANKPLSFEWDNITNEINWI